MTSSANVVVRVPAPLQLSERRGDANYNVRATAHGLYTNPETALVNAHGGKDETTRLGLAASYQDLNNLGWGHERMLELVQHIISSGAASRLFAYTSLDVLKVSNYEPLEDSEILRIHFDRQKQLFCFDYFASGTGSELYAQDQPEFQRQYPAESVIEKFDQFLRWIRW